MNSKYFSDPDTITPPPTTIDGTNEQEMEDAVRHHLDDLANGKIVVTMPNFDRPLARGTYRT